MKVKLISKNNALNFENLKPNLVYKCLATNDKIKTNFIILIKISLLSHLPTLVNVNLKSMS